MRQLSDHELKLVQQGIAEKEINSVELVMEIYDHYISHLEEYSKEEFDVQLSALNEKWTYGYCKKLQDDLRKNINNSVRKTQWGLIKSYFTWPKLMFTIILITVITLLVNLLTGKIQLIILFLFPLIYLVGFAGLIMLRTHQKIKPIKDTFKNSGLKINSISSSLFITYLTLPLHFYNFFLNVPRLFGLDKFVPDHLLNYLSITFCFIIYLHSISAYEAWKIKSKTALI